MTIVPMAQFGITLTDRADGKKFYQEILRKYSRPVALDFSGVISLGSSFGDEVIPKLAAEQENNMTIMHTNTVIKHSIMRVVEDTSINIAFED